MENLKVKRNIKAFDGERYSVWKFRLRALLSELDVLKVLDDEKLDKKSDEWKKADKVAKSVIIEYLSDSFLGFVKVESSAKEIIQSLDAIYERKSLATQLALRKKLLGLKLHGDIQLIKHFQTFDDLMTELLSAGAKLEETDKVSHLLLTLPSTYDGVITAIETLSEDNLTLAFVKTRLLDHEVKIQSESKDTSAKVLHAESVNVETSKSHKFQQKGQFKRRFPKSKFKKNSNLKCHYCGRKGHIKKDCYYYKRTQQDERQRTVQAVEITQPSTSNAANTSSFAFMTGNYQFENGDKEIFILDSGASDHLINNEESFSNFIELQPPIKISVAKNGTFINATKKGTINVISNKGIKGVFKDVLYSPEVPHNLLSVRKMQQRGMTITFDQKGVEIRKGGKIINNGKSLNNLTVIDFKIMKYNSNSTIQILSTERDNYNLWHQRLGHIGKSKFLELKNKQMINDLGQIEKVTPNDNLCEPCINGKQARLPFEKVKDKRYVRRPLFIVHSDVCGPITPTTIDNKNYFVLFVDEFTHYCVSYLITYKSDVFSIFKDFIAKSEAHFNLKVVHLYCDNGREYLSNEMKDYCVQKGISYHLTVPRTPQLNGVSERMVRTITEKARAMISGASLEKHFWGEAILTATYLINLTPTKALNINKTPYELWHSKKPQIKYLKVFGSTVYVHNKTRKTKFEEKSWKGILVGYEPNGYKVWDVETEKFVVVRDVIFDETNFLESRQKINSKGVNSENSRNKTGGSNLVVPEVRLKSVEMESHKSDDNKSDMSKERHETIPNKIAKLDQKSNKSVIKTDMHTESLSQVNENNENKFSEPRRSDRIKHQPCKSYNEENTLYDYLLCAQSIVYKIPTSYNEIKDSENRIQWEKAIKDEINSLLFNKTWTLVSMPKNRNIVDCKWVFTVKNDEFGNPLKFKARVVARGFSQVYLTDYNETFAPVARIPSFRFIIAFSNQFNLLVHHMDVKTAFLNGILKEEIYMRVPEGVECKANQVCKLNKAIYGLKQAARCWFEMFEKVLFEKGFRNSAVDRCIYILDRGHVSKNIYVVLYVDDLVIATANFETMNRFKNYLMEKFFMTDLKDIKLFLGIRVLRSENKITLDQSAYIKTILDKFNMSDCKAVSTPLENKLNYRVLNSDEKFDAPCRNLIGCLMYVMLCTRPDLSVAVNILSRYLTKNNKELWQCLKRVLRYLKGSIDIKLNYMRGNYNDLLIGYVDSDWGGNDEKDRKSTTGFLFKLFEQCTICWSTKRQLSVAASSTEAEYMALFEAVREAMWLKALATSINVNIEKPIIIYEDNNGCISIANNPTCHKRSKHIDIKYHFSREQVEKNIIKLNYISTGNQLADILTKPLSAVKFLEFRAGMGLK